MSVYNYEINVRRYYIPTEEKNTKGNPVTIPVVIRTMFLLLKCPCNSGLFTDMRIIRYKRNNNWFYSVSRPVQLPAYLPRKWKKHETVSEYQFVDWLGRRIGKCEAVLAINRLITEIPNKNEAQ